MEVRFDKIEFAKPMLCTDKNAPQNMTLYVCDVKEIASSVPEGEEPVHWCLLTTHTIETINMAHQIVEWYQERWKIEQLIRTLKKQGLDVESSQLETEVRLIKISVMALHVAVQTLQLTMAREGKDQPIGTVFNRQECTMLKSVLKTVEGKTALQKNPFCHSKLSWAAWIIARLGGWKGYPSESPPGPITMRNGLEKFRLMLEGAKITHQFVCID